MNILELKAKHIYSYQRIIGGGKDGIYYTLKKPNQSSRLDHWLPLDALLMPVDDEILDDQDGKPVIYYRKVIGVNIEFLGWIGTYIHLTEFIEVEDHEHP